MTNGFSSGKLLIGAALFICLSGGLWVGLRPSMPPVGDDGACRTSAAMAGKLKPLATGKMAALMVRSAPRALPPLAFTDAEGKPLALANLQGKALLLNLWATWCAPCREEMPALNMLQRDLGGDRFAVVAVNVDTRATERPRQWLKEQGIEALAYYSDPTAGVLKTLQQNNYVQGLPASFIVDAKGCELARLLGGADWASPEGRKIVEVLTDTPGSP